MAWGDARLVDLFLHQRIAGKKISGSAILLERSIVEMTGKVLKKNIWASGAIPMVGRGGEIEVG